MNHEEELRATTCRQQFGDLMIVRAARGLSKGEELTTTYGDDADAEGTWGLGWS
jgi:hypothetical protein